MPDTPTAIALPLDRPALEAACLRALGSVYEKMRRWSQAAAILQRQARETTDGPERLAALRRVAGIAEQELHDVDLAMIDGALPERVNKPTEGVNGSDLTFDTSGRFLTHCRDRFITGFGGAMPTHLPPSSPTAARGCRCPADGPARGQHGSTLGRHAGLPCASAGGAS